uniref:Type III pantothenate kinase n=1 Tax=Eubacterium cellulosolvens (strain ATCC 43171 / JCM 9499 / 6) TaxID=633697 RepID=I5AU30_EUBC6
MILAIDIGNTHMVLGCVNEQTNEVISSMQMSTDRVETAHEYAAEIVQILALEKISPEDFCGAIISSVVPMVTTVVKKAVEIITGEKPLVLGEGTDIGMEVDMNGIPADAIAGDLLATAVAAKEAHTLPAIIIDMGTATTVTVVDSRGIYIGGAILPGPGTAMKGLVSDTSLLPAIDFTAPDRAIAKDTINAMKSGIIYGSAGAVDGILERYEEELTASGETKRPVIVATGGMGRIIAPFCRHEILVDDQLLLKGLSIIWKKNN